MLLIISWASPVVSILIKSQTVANDFKEYFEAMWPLARN